MTMQTLILYPDNYFNPNEPDIDYQKEFVAARNLGFEIGFLSNEALDDAQIHLNIPRNFSGDVLYRGWMIKPDLYALLYDNLMKYGCRLITPPEIYTRFHTLPGYYHLIQSDTPKAVWFDRNVPIDWTQVRTLMSKCLVKDFVKSVKNTNFPAYLNLHSSSNDELNKWIQIFIQMRDDLFTGGIVLKEYVNLKKYDGKTNEWRAFYLSGHLLCVCRNSSQPADTPQVPQTLLAKYAFPGFYTIDFAELESGSWTIIECGDGQVSGLPDTLAADEFYSKLKQQLSSNITHPKCRLHPNPDVVFPLSNCKTLIHIKPTIHNPNIIVGDFSYFGDVDFEKHVTHHYDFIGDKLIIGKFCQIAAGVEFVMNGANHQMNAVSTFPFYIFNGWDTNAPSLSELPLKGDTVVGNDVWIGQNVTILPGVHIGDGAIIGANSVVGSDVEPYRIVAGNPAKVIRKRFDDELIELLLKFQWWNKSIEEIQALIPILTCGDLERVKQENRGKL